MKWISGDKEYQIVHHQQRGASDPISGLTGLCVYLFYPNLFASQINLIFPKKTTVTPP